MRSDEFLKRYRVLEDMLEKRYSNEDMTGKSVIVQYIGDPDSKGLRSDLDMMRVIRNLLTHNADSDGSSVVEPSQEVLDKLEQIIVHVRTPRTANDYGTPNQQILFAHPNDRVTDLIGGMKNRGYSFLPICEKGVMKGMFSRDSIFNYVVAEGMKALTADMRVKDFETYTAFDQYPKGSYCFVPRDLSVIGVVDAFNQWTDTAHRLQIAFVTKSGSPDEPLLRLITPWDVLSIGEVGADANAGKNDI